MVLVPSSQVLSSKHPIPPPSLGKEDVGNSRGNIDMNGAQWAIVGLVFSSYLFMMHAIAMGPERTVRTMANPIPVIGIGSSFYILLFSSRQLICTMYLPHISTHGSLKYLYQLCVMTSSMSLIMALACASDAEVRDEARRFTVAFAGYQCVAVAFIYIVNRLLFSEVGGNDLQDSEKGDNLPNESVRIV